MKNWHLEIKRLAKLYRRPGGTLIAQTTTNDPFHASTPGRLERSQWFADLYRRFEIKPGAHLRRIHYVLVSQSAPIRMVDGESFENAGVLAGSKRSRTRCPVLTSVRS
jgi:hypothetical protein